MILPAESLLKYDSPVLVSRSSGATSPKGRSFVVSPQQNQETSPVPPPPKRPTTELSDQEHNILNRILPPREWAEGTQLWVQKVSTAPCTRRDVMQLNEQLHVKLQEKQARLTGICDIRRELYSQCFDELIRQVTINCDERGLLLSMVREEIEMTIATYKTLYESSVAFGMRKVLLSEHGMADMEKRVATVESEKQELIKQLNEQKGKCDEIEKREAERRQTEEKKLNDEIDHLKRNNRQLKNQLESIATARN